MWIIVKHLIANDRQWQVEFMFSRPLLYWKLRSNCCISIFETIYGGCSRVESDHLLLKVPTVFRHNFTLCQFGMVVQSLWQHGNFIITIPITLPVTSSIMIGPIPIIIWAKTLKHMYTNCSVEMWWGWKVFTVRPPFPQMTFDLKYKRWRLSKYSTNPDREWLQLKFAQFTMLYTVNVTAYCGHMARITFQPC